MSFAVGATAGFILHNNIDILVESVEKTAKAIRRKIFQLPTHQCRHFGLVNAENLSGFLLVKMAVPRAYGGLELDPMTQVRVVEELSRLDGSVGWCAMISSAGSFAGAFMVPAVAQRVCGSIDFSLAGQVVPVGRAELVNGGYRVTGRYRFGSGCQHASVIVGGCVVFEDGKPRQLANGQPEIRAVEELREHCAALPEAAQQQIMGANAARCYGL